MTSHNLKILLSMAAAFVVMGISAMAFAQGEVFSAEQLAQIAVDKDMSRINNGGIIALGCGFGIGLAALGGAIGQGKTAAAALEGIARNPASADRIFTPMILGLALIESLVIYALVIAIMLQGKII
jgi:F-type H+-transporting ATPase subunit c